MQDDPAAGESYDEIKAMRACLRFMRALSADCPINDQEIEDDLRFHLDQGTSISALQLEADRLSREPTITNLNSASDLSTPQCALFLTTLVNDRIARHFQRLRNETTGMLDIHIVINPFRVPNPICAITGEKAAQLMPKRWAEMLGQEKMVPGYVDLLWVPVAIKAGYAHTWIVEFDTDYAGNWREFFSRFLVNDADVLATTLLDWRDAPNWHFRSTCAAPMSVSSAVWCKSFLPIGRFSKRFLLAYAAAMQSDDWRGHFEFTIPTLARHLRMSVEDIGGNGRNYLNTPSVSHLGPGTLIWRPSRTAYFHEAPETFDRKGLLYHPVKPA
jgi:hypothetical protein